MWAKGLIAGFMVSLSAGFVAADAPAIYDTPQDAFEAFAEALTNGEREAMPVIFGANAEDLLSTGDVDQDQANRAIVLELLDDGYRFRREDGLIEILLGAEGWPFPIPLGRVDGGWQFDIAAGREEILARDIGFNELEVIVLLEAYVDLQAEFRRVDHDEDGVMEFARSIISEPGARDGLFWPEERGFVGAALARAAALGWSDGEADLAPEPFNGYYFRILHSQTENAPGGAADYLIGDNLVSGHALLAVPAFYGETGVHSFMVAENGLIFEADFGQDTLETSGAITSYDPGPDWRVVDIN